MRTGLPGGVPPAPNNEFPVVTIPADTFRRILQGDSMRVIFEDIRRESQRRGLDYSPDLGFICWTNEAGDYCQQNFKARNGGRGNRPGG